MCSETAQRNCVLVPFGKQTWILKMTRITDYFTILKMVIFNIHACLPDGICLNSIHPIHYRDCWDAECFFDMWPASLVKAAKSASQQEPWILFNLPIIPIMLPLHMQVCVFRSVIWRPIHTRTVRRRSSLKRRRIRLDHPKRFGAAVGCHPQAKELAGLLRELQVASKWIMIWTNAPKSHLIVTVFNAEFISINVY